MSVQAIAAVFAIGRSAKITSGETIVLLALANRASVEDSSCWPSLERLATECRLTRRRICQIINRLADAGMLERKERYGNKGEQRSTMYFLRVTDWPQDDALTKPRPAPPVQPTSPPLCSGLHPEPSVEPSVEPSPKEEDFPGDEAAGAIPVSSPEPKKPTKPKAEPKPEPKPWWDAVCDIFGMHAITKSDKSRIGKLARDFKAKCEYVGLGLDEIDARRDNLIAKWNDAAKVTPEALLKHWDLAGDDQNIFRPREPTPEEIAEHEAVCRGEIPA